MIAANVADVVDLYERFGHDRYDEDVSQMDHALQTAALARAEAAPEELVIAALLHDIGHLLDLAGVTGRSAKTAEPTTAEPTTTLDLRHEASGARYLAGLYPPSVTGPIALHVGAKRYLCSVEPGYETGLSRGSTASLVAQGAAMDDSEVSAFERNPWAPSALRLRRWDDMGKVDRLDVAGLDSYSSILERVARG